MSKEQFQEVRNIVNDKVVPPASILKALLADVEAGRITKIVVVVSPEQVTPSGLAASCVFSSHSINETRRLLITGMADICCPARDV